MEKLKVKKVEYFEVDSSRLEDFMNHHFPSLIVDLVADNEWTRGSNYPFTATKQLTEYEQIEADNLINGQNTGGTYRFYPALMINALCYKNLIEEGNYLILVSQ